MKTREAFIKQKLEARKHVLSESPKPKPKDNKWMIDKINHENEKRRASSSKVADNVLEDGILSADSREDSVDSLFDFGETREQNQSSTLDERPFSYIKSQNEINPFCDRLNSQQSKPTSTFHNRSWSPAQRHLSEQVSTHHSRLPISHSPQGACTHQPQSPESASRQLLTQRASAHHDRLRTYSDASHPIESANDYKGIADNSHKYVEFKHMNMNELNDRATTRIQTVRLSTIGTILGKGEQRRDKRSELKMAYRNATVEELLRYGDSYFNKEDYDTAKTRYANAIYKAKQSDSVDERIADAHLRLAAIYSRGEDINEIIKHFTHAQEIYEKLYIERKTKKENVSHLGKKIIEVMTSIANCYANANDIEGALLAHKHVINRTERYFPHNVSLNVKVLNAYAYTLYFAAKDHEKSLRMLNYIISQYSHDNLDDEVLQSLAIKGKILLSLCRSTTKNIIKEEYAKEAGGCFMKVVQIHKMHPAKYSSDQMAALIALNRSAREIQKEIENEKNATVIEENDYENNDLGDYVPDDYSNNNNRKKRMEKEKTDNDSNRHEKLMEKEQKMQINEADSESICTIESGASNGMNFCQWFFDIEDD